MEALQLLLLLQLHQLCEFDVLISAVRRVLEKKRTKQQHVCPTWSLG